MYTMSIYGTDIRAASWSTNPEDAPGDAPGDDCPDHGPYADDECPKCGPVYDRAAAIALQAMLDAQQRGRCLNCGGEHRTWACPEIAPLLFA